MLKNKFTRNKDQYDSIESTYKHIIYTNVGKKYQLTGYSKGNGLPERKDKEILLQRCILRLISRAYLRNSDKIEFYKKDWLDSRHDELILVLYSNRYEYSDKTEWIQPFLTAVYERILKGIALDDNIIIDRAKGFKKIGLDIFLYKELCRDQQEFKDYMDTLISHAEIPQDVVLKFYHTYKNDFKI